jgi:hypothetical protein
MPGPPVLREQMPRFMTSGQFDGYVAEGGDRSDGLESIVSGDRRMNDSYSQLIAGHQPSDSTSFRTASADWRSTV